MTHEIVQETPIPEEVRHLLQVIFDRFKQTGEWPLIEDLRYELDQADDELDVPAAATVMDPSLGHASDRGNTARATLTIHGVVECDGSDEVLADVLAYAQLAYSQYREQGREARVTSDDLSTKLDMDPLRVRRTYELTQWIPGIGGGGGNPPDSWYRQLSADVIYLRHVGTVPALLAKAPRIGHRTAPSLPQGWTGTVLSGGAGDRLRNLGDHVSREVQRMNANIDNDPPDAITAARALVETVCRTLLEEMGLAKGTESDDLTPLYKKAAAGLGLDAGKSDVVHRQMLQGLLNTVQGLAEVRNSLGDAHGSAPGRAVALPRHARAAATAAIAVSVFLLETANERRNTLP
jgi:hypothetical protein